MRFSVTTTEKNGILQACERLTRLDDAGITGVTATLAQFTNYVNEELRTVWALIHRVYGGWQFDDMNQANLPSASTALVASQGKYAVPSESLVVRGIEVKDTGGIWHTLKPITEEQIREFSAVGEFMKVASNPIYYQLVGRTIKLFPAPSYSQDDSLKVFYERGSVAFLTTDTTEEPGFASEFHDVLPLGASIKWFQINTPEDLTLPHLIGQYKVKLTDLETFYKSRFREMFPQKVRRAKQSWS